MSTMPDWFIPVALAATFGALTGAALGITYARRATRREQRDWRNGWVDVLLQAEQTDVENRRLHHQISRLRSALQQLADGILLIAAAAPRSAVADDLKALRAEILTTIDREPR